MTKHLEILIFLSLLIFQDAFSQNDTTKISKDCEKKFIKFVKLAKLKDYDNAYQPWLWTFQGCPDYSKHIYTYGLKIVEGRYKNASSDKKAIEAVLIDSIFVKRIRYFPQRLGKTYSDWASSLENRGATKDGVFEKLNLAYHTDPTGLSMKNIVTYFREISDKYKNSNPQKVIEVYDELTEVRNLKIDRLSMQLDALNDKESGGAVLSSKEKLLQGNNTIHLRGLSQLQILLDTINSNEGSTTCE